MEELLIENMTMKRLLREHGIGDLDDILRQEKSDPVTQELVQARVAPLRTAIRDEIELGRIIDGIVAHPPPTKGSA